MPAISALDYSEQSVPPTSCAGCGVKIADRYYLLAVDRPWHVRCLKCSECKSQLDTELTCFARDGNIYCKEDYYRLFAVKRCARCQRGIFANELVMRARDLVYHLHCFTCAWCNAALAQGDYFGLRDNLVYCRTHYELLTQGEAYGTGGPAIGMGCGGPSPPQTPGSDMIPLSLQASSRCNSPAQPMTPNTMTVLAGHPSTGCDRTSEISHENVGLVNHLQVSSAATPYSHAVLYPTSTAASLQGGGGTTVRKGRPRKRKSGDQQQGMTPNSQLGVSVMEHGSSHCGGGMGHMGSGLSDSSSPGGMTGSGQMPNGHHGGGGGGPNGGHGQRTKRMRTSFKHHQLRTMKSYFSINQNPDAKDLKQLAQKTGLSKRVLQVWFQNARAKWRRNNLKSGDGSQAGSQTGSIPGGHQSSGSMHHHHSMSGMPGSPGGTSSFSEASPAAPCGGGMGPDTPGPHSHHAASMDYNGNGSLMGHHHVSDSLPLTSFQELF